MCFFISLIPATFWLVVGYVVLYISFKSDGQTKKFGQVLAIWIFTIAAFIPILGLVVTFSDLCPITEIMEKMLVQ